MCHSNFIHTSEQLIDCCMVRAVNAIVAENSTQKGAYKPCMWTYFVCMYMCIRSGCASGCVRTSRGASDGGSILAYLCVGVPGIGSQTRHGCHAHACHVCPRPRALARPRLARPHGRSSRPRHTGTRMCGSVRVSGVCGVCECMWGANSVPCGALPCWAGLDVGRAWRFIVFPQANTLFLAWRHSSGPLSRISKS